MPQDVVFRYCQASRCGSGPEPESTSLPHVADNSQSSEPPTSVETSGGNGVSLGVAAVPNATHVLPNESMCINCMLCMALSDLRCV